ncbi:MAG: flagellar hook-length control protein FliK [Rhodopirellula sp.]|nr:flagellar hook-length control protein FliK [Rhodopirellula sp.]
MLNDVLIPESEAAGRDARFTSTEPFLIASIPVNAEAVHVSTSFEHDDLMSYPTLPSLRPDRVSTVQVASQIATGSDVPNSQRVENAAYEGLAGSAISAAVDNLPDTMEAVDVPSDSSVAGDAATQLPSDFPLPGDVSNSDTVPLILPSLANGVKRRTEANRETGKLASAISQGPDSAQLAIRDSSFRSQDVAAVSGAIPSAVRSEAGSGSGSSSTVQEQGPSLSPVQPKPTPGRIVPESAIRDSQSSNAAVVPSPAVVPEATRPGDDQQNAQVPFSEAVTVEARISQNRPQDESSQADTVTPGSIDTSSLPGDANTPVSEPVETTGGFASEPPQQVSPQVQEFANARTRPQPSSSAEKQSDADRVALKTEPAVLVDDPRDSTADRREGESSEQRQDSPLVPQQASTIVVDVGAAAIADRPPVVPERAATILDDAVPIQTDLQSQSVRSVSTPNNQARVRDHVPQALSDFPEVTPIEARTENTADVVSAENPASRVAPQKAQSLTPGPVRADAVLDLLVDPTDNSPSRGIDSSNASVSAIAVETGSADIAAGTSSPGPAVPASTTTSSGVGKTDSVRAPAVPMEIQDAVSAIQDATSGDSHIRVRLNPRELGHMLVDVSRINGVIVARLEVESAAARVAVLDTLPHLQHALTHSGASVDRIDVVLTESRAESGRQESNQSQPRDQQQSRHDRQSSDQRQARDEQNQHRQNQQRQDERRRNQSGTDAFSGNSPDSEPLDELDVKL